MDQNNQALGNSNQTNNTVNIDKSYTVDYKPNVTNEPVTPNVAPEEQPVFQDKPVENKVSGTSNEQVSTQTTSAPSGVKELTIPNPNGGDPSVVTVSSDIRMLDEKEQSPDGLKFIGIVFAILLLVLFLLPYLYQLLK